MQIGPLTIATIVSQPFAENTYIASLAGRSDCLIYDPGFEPDRILEHLEAKNLSPAAIMLTHGHIDHIAGNGHLKERFPYCPLVIGANEADKLTDPAGNLSGLYGFPITSPPADALVREGETYSAAGIDLEVLEIPGHSSGHVVFVWKGESGTPEPHPWVVFGGDVLFQRGIGRTDFPDGSFEQLSEGIHRKLFTLPGDTIILPGHGEPTTIGEEREENPFVGKTLG